MNLILNPSSIADYRTFLKVKQLPSYRIRGRVASFPDEYADRLGVRHERPHEGGYVAPSWMFDYQRDMMGVILRKKRFALFWDCGLGKTPMLLEYARVVHSILGQHKGVLIVSPLMVVPQTMQEAKKFFGEDSIPIEQVTAKSIGMWLRTCGGRIGITNYDAITDDLQQGDLGCLILDESSMLKSHYGKWATKLIELGRGLDWKLCLTGTPAPNDRIEYANHAVFLDHFPTVNSFLARYFVNRGQTNERWELRPHAIRPFYTSLSHWCHFLTNPATYGWKDNSTTIPPIHVHIHEVPLTKEQVALVGKQSGELFTTKLGGIVGRSAYGAISKGFYKGYRVPTNKPGFIKDLVAKHADESTIIWCIYNEEQEIVAEQFDDPANIAGSTPIHRRIELIDAFKRGDRRTLISKPKILGFGLNLQKATRQIFSGLQDSYESYYQAVKRSNRYGSTRPLNVDIPITDVESPMVENVLRKSKRVQEDTDEQERLFKTLTDIGAGT